MGKSTAQRPASSLPVPSVPQHQAPTPSTSHILQAQTSTPLQPSTASQPVILHESQQSGNRAYSTAVLTESHSASQHALNVPPHSPAAGLQDANTNDAGISIGSRASALKFPGEQDMTRDMRNKLHAFGALFLDRLSDSATSAGLCDATASQVAPKASTAEAAIHALPVTGMRSLIYSESVPEKNFVETWCTWLKPRLIYAHRVLFYPNQRFSSRIAVWFEESVQIHAQLQWCRLVESHCMSFCISCNTVMFVICSTVFLCIW